MSNSDSRRKAAALRRLKIRSKAPPLTGSPADQPRFVADVMLGRLAKWLRIAGFDVVYSNRFRDDELVAVSKSEGRILLSRDTRLLIRKSVGKFIFLESDQVQDQIRQILRATRTETLSGVLTRCLGCNEVLLAVSREQVQGSVPPYVFDTQSGFKCCPRCHKIYWAGTHRQSVIRTLEQLL